MKIKVKFFALQREAVGKSEIELELERKTTINKIREILMEKYPKLRKLDKVTLVALNQNYARGPEVLKDGDEVALFPFVGGG